jgi:hypothetical protein
MFELSLEVFRMKNRIFAIVALCVLVLNLGGSTLADTRAKAAKRAQSNQLVALLPASDGVVTIDVKRFFGEALPKLLSSNQPMLAEIVGHIEEAKARTGIDIRQFEYVTAGVSARKIADKKYDLDPVVIARGQVNSSALIGAAKLAANGKYRENRVGERTIYIFDAKQIAKQHKPQNATGKRAEMIDKMIGKMSSELAVTAYDSKTLVFGDLARVRETLEAKTHVGADITGLLDRKEFSVVNFAAKIPEGMSAFLPMENDELGKNIDAISYIYGNMDVAGENTTVSMTARTLQNAQAESLRETLEGLQFIGKAFLGKAKGADKQVYGRMIDNAKITAKGNEVMFDLSVPQSDIDILVGLLR